MDLSKIEAKVMLMKTARKRFEVYKKYQVHISKLAYGLQGIVDHT